ncbi:MAG: zinc-ribbon domain-containing protein [Anaerolineae bacterium]|nr:zinc-ribbon domain-containing protein [Anaerolineae bacterium]
MKCTRCGFENRPDARFCKQCGQPLAVQPAPPPVEEMLCPACGASYKPGARFCSRCGNPLTTGAMPPPQPPTQPSMPPPPSYPPEFGTPPFQQPPPPAAAAYPSRRVPAVVWVLGGVVLVLCIALLAVGVFYLGPKLGLPLPAQGAPTATPAATETPAAVTQEAPQPTETPVPAPVDVASFGAQVTVSLPPTISLGSTSNVTVTISNTGGVPLSELRYQLFGEWGNVLDVRPQLIAPGGQLEPGQSAEAIFTLEAREAGTVTLRANVTAKISGTSEVRAISSDVVTIQIQ